MTRQEIATLACKILALWALAQAILHGSNFIMVVVLLLVNGFHTEGSPAIIVYNCIPPTVMLILGLLFWYCAPRIAIRMVSTDPAPVTRSDVNQESLLSIAFAATGMFILIPALYNLAGKLIGYVSVGGNWEFLVPEQWSSSTWQAGFWSSIIALGLSIWLIFGSRGIARFVLRMRRAEPKSEG